jgi:hypothetical protein
MKLVSRQKAGQARLELIGKEDGWDSQSGSALASVLPTVRAQSEVSDLRAMGHLSLLSETQLFRRF